MSEREYAQLKRMLGCQNVRELLPLAGQHLYIEIPLLIESLGKIWGYRTLRRTRIGRTPQCPVHQISPRVSHVQSSTVVLVSTGHSGAFHRTHHTRCPMRSSKLPELGNAHRTRLTHHHRTRHRVLCSPALWLRATSAGTGC
jgi:hypothetical protein